MREDYPRRADAFKHYLVAMRLSLAQIAQCLRPGSPAVLIVGKSQWNGAQIPTAGLFRELAAGDYELEHMYWYPLKNRYMSYSRRNGADISSEQVLVFRRR